VTLLDVHEAWAWVTVVANGLTGLWALGAHRLAPLRARALWWSTAVAQVSMFVQVVLGVLVVTVEDVEAPEFHMFYGFIAILAIGLIYSYRAQAAQWRYLLYGFGSLFVMGLGIRAMFLA
jgi:hypothetical protein